MNYYNGSSFTVDLADAIQVVKVQHLGTLFMFLISKMHSLIVD
jgi:hypothetical protein